MGRATPDTAHIIDAAIEVADAVAARDALLEVVAKAGPAARVTLELSGPAPTAVALQLLAAARRSLAAQDGLTSVGARDRRA